MVSFFLRIFDFLHERRRLCMASLTVLVCLLLLMMASLRYNENIFELQMKGYDVILAHPERYPYLNIDGKRIEQLLNQGVYMQVNVLSLGGFYGEEAKRRAFAMIERGWISFLGTDTHNNLYCQALRETSRERKVEKILEKYQFMNNTL